jgi:hypothetical protein
MARALKDLKSIDCRPKYEAHFRRYHIGPSRIAAPRPRPHHALPPHVRARAAPRTRGAVLAIRDGVKYFMREV